jgi:hypothetical protein
LSFRQFSLNNDKKLFNLVGIIKTTCYFVKKIFKQSINIRTVRAELILVETGRIVWEGGENFFPVKITNAIFERRA